MSRQLLRRRNTVTVSHQCWRYGACSNENMWCKSCDVRLDICPVSISARRAALALDQQASRAGKSIPVPTLSRPQAKIVCRAGKSIIHMLLRVIKRTQAISDSSVSDKAAPPFRSQWIFNPLIATLKPQSNGPSYSNTVIGTLAVDGWAVTFGTARRGLSVVAARPGPSSLYQMQQPTPLQRPVYTNFVLFDVEL